MTTDFEVLVPAEAQVVGTMGITAGKVLVLGYGIHGYGLCLYSRGRPWCCCFERDGTRSLLRGPPLLLTLGRLLSRLAVRLWSSVYNNGLHPCHKRVHASVKRFRVGRDDE